MNTEFNLEFLQALFVCCRCEVINIRVRDIICLTKQITIIVVIDDSGRQFEDLNRAVTEHGCVQDMVIIPAVIKPDQLIVEEFFNLTWFWINHSDARMSRPLNLPNNQEEVREDFDIEEYNWIILIRSNWICRIIRLEVHLCRKLQTVVRLICTLHGKVDHSVLHISNIIVHPALISVLQHFVDEIDIRTCIAMNLFA